MVGEGPSLERVLTRIAAILLLPALALVIIDEWPYLTERFSRGQVIGRDAYNFWMAARLVVEGRIAEVYDHLAFAAAVKDQLGPGAGLHAFPYPPPALLGLVPFGLLPYEVALALWSLIGAVAFLAAVAWPRPDRLTVLLALAAPMTLVNIGIGQNGLLSAALFIGGLRLAGSRPVLAGVLIGLMIYKPFLGLLMPVALVLGGHWRAVWAAGATVILACLLPAVIWGPDVWRLYIADTVPYQRFLLEQGTGLAQFMKPSAFMSLRLLGAGLTPAYLVQGACSALVLALAVGYLWRYRRLPLDGRAMAVMAAATVLLVPYVHVYDLTIVAGAQLVMLRDTPDRLLSPGELAAHQLLWFIPLGGLLLAIAGLPVAPLVLLGALAALIRRPVAT